MGLIPSEDDRLRLTKPMSAAERESLREVIMAFEDAQRDLMGLNDKSDEAVGAWRRFLDWLLRRW